MTNFLSVCTFFAALLFFSFEDTTTSICISVGIAASIVSALIFWCIVNSWDSGDGYSRDAELIDEDELYDEGHHYGQEQNAT
jgi:hypothetical protein